MGVQRKVHECIQSHRVGAHRSTGYWAFPEECKGQGMGRIEVTVPLDPNHRAEFLVQYVLTVTAGGTCRRLHKAMQE